jgi:hypothetical protein
MRSDFQGAIHTLQNDNHKLTKLLDEEKETLRGEKLAWKETVNTLMALIPSPRQQS